MWHAGDWGGIEVSDALPSHVTIRGVFGNIDDHIVRKVYPKENLFTVEGLTVYMTHIGGYPGRYAKGISDRLKRVKPDLFVCGHSHICKVMRDNKLNLMHFNSGAIGNKGFHKKRTMLRFAIENGKLFDVKVLEYDRIYDNEN